MCKKQLFVTTSHCLLYVQDMTVCSYLLRSIPYTRHKTQPFEPVLLHQQSEHVAAICSYVSSTCKTHNFQHGRTPFIRTLVIRMANYPDRFDHSIKHFLTVNLLHYFVA